MKIIGKVKSDKGRGKRLGFPTANFDLDAEIEDGIYLGTAENKPALIFIGANITFDEHNRHVEVYVLDFDQDLYGQEITVELIKKIRDNKKFDSERELIEQMKSDEQVAREYFANYNKSN